MPAVRDIEDLLVWAFRNQRVQRYAASLRGAALGPSSSLESGIGQILAMGTKVDTTAAGAKWLGARCHDDAVTLYDAVMALPEDARVEVVKHARVADEPYWYPEGPGQWVTPRDKWGKPKMLYRDPVRQRGPIGEAPPELIGVDPSMVEEARAIYRLWHASLCELANMAQGELVEFRAAWPGRSPEPWLDLPVEQFASC